MYEVDFWRSNQTKLIRVGKRDKYGVLRPIKFVGVVGDDYSDAEAKLAQEICDDLNGWIK